MVKIIIPGVPVSQARMKFSSFGGFTRVYDPREKEKKHIRNFLLSQQISMFSNYPRISFLFHMPIPKSISKKELELHNSITLKHIKKPDVDNLVKLYLDCLVGIVIVKDEIVSLGYCDKVYSPEPKTEIWIEETTRLIEYNRFPS